VSDVTWTPAERDAAVSRVADVVARLPGTTTEEAHGHVGWRVRGKRFAWLLVDHHGDGRLGLCVKAERGELEALTSADPVRYYRPAYLGADGWVGAKLDPASDPDWPEIDALLEQGWRLQAGKRAVAAYDAERRTEP
jgi:hypothetical protein